MTVHIVVGDAREALARLPSGIAHTCVTSPPYFGLRDYGVAGQIGLEPSPEDYIAELVAVFREARRVLRDDGTLFLNLGDSYASTGGHTKQGASSQRNGRANVDVQNGVKGFAGGNGIKLKDLLMIPAQVALALRADGWWLRSDIIWHKKNPMPESVTDRPTSAHEHVFLLAKSATYYFDAEAVKEPATGEQKAYRTGRAYINQNAIPDNSEHAGTVFRGDYDPSCRNIRNVWTIATKPFKGAHFATFPPKLIEPCILAGCPVGGVILDPFFGAGTTGLVAQEHGRSCIGIELNPAYAELARARIPGSVVHAVRPPVADAA